jgi:hypothetical protein
MSIVDPPVLLAYFLHEAGLHRMVVMRHDDHHHHHTDDGQR